MAGSDYYDSAVNKYLNTYTTFSGADIVATFGGIEIGALSAWNRRLIDLHRV